MKAEPPVESERRRADFRAEVPIVMGDGGTWYFPRPRLSGRYLAYADPADRGDPQKALAVGITEFGPEYDWRVEEALINNFNKKLTNAELDWFARFLLGVNYDLSDRDFYFLLPFRGSDEDNGRMWRDVFLASCDLMMLESPDPKAPSAGVENSSNGSGSASSPTASTPGASPSVAPTASPRP